MRRVVLGIVFACFAVAALGWWLSRRAPTPAPTAAVTQEAAPTAVVTEEAARPEAPAPKSEARSSAVDVASPPGAVPESSEPGPLLDDLLRLPPPAPAESTGVEWAGETEDAAEGDDAPRKPRPRINVSQENVTEGVPMQKARRRTDVGVSVPVGEKDRVRIKGGVRVDERELSETEREADKTPTVGVEVKF